MAQATNYEREREMEYMYCDSDERQEFVAAVRDLGIPHKTTLIGSGPDCYYLTAAGPMSPEQAEEVRAAVTALWGRCWLPVGPYRCPLTTGGRPNWWTA